MLAFLTYALWRLESWNMQPMWTLGVEAQQSQARHRRARQAALAVGAQSPHNSDPCITRNCCISCALSHPHVVKNGLPRGPCDAVLRLINRSVQLQRSPFHVAQRPGHPLTYLHPPSPDHRPLLPQHPRVPTPAPNTAPFSMGCSGSKSVSTGGAYDTIKQTVLFEAKGDPKSRCFAMVRMVPNSRVRAAPSDVACMPFTELLPLLLPAARSD